MKKRAYLDHASATPTGARALRVFVKAVAEFGNPSAPHTEGLRARALLEEARTRIARLAGVKSEAITFTSGATESNNIVIAGVIEAAHARGIAYEAMHVLYLEAGHASTVEPVRALAALGVRIETLPLADGAVDTLALEQLITKDTLLVVMDAVCGESGTRWNTRDVARALQNGKSKAVLHVDASQLPLVESIERMRLGADTVTLDASKVGGVRGIGVLVRPQHVALAPRMLGGGQEQGLRSGTQVPALAVAFAEALEDADGERAAFTARAKEFRTYVLSEIEMLPGAYIYSGKETAPHIVSASFPGRDTDYLAALLDARGYAVSTRSACETDAIGSRVLLLLTQDEGRSQATLRISFGHTTTQKELHGFMKELRAALAFIDAQTL